MTNKKADILDATASCFYEKGDGFTLNDVAAKAGCSKTLILRYYGNRRNLMSECFDMIHLDVHNVLNDTLNGISDDDVGTIMRVAVETYLGYLLDNREKGNFYIRHLAKYRQLPDGRMMGGVVREMLGSRYDRLKARYPELDVEVNYLVAVTGIVATGIFRGWFGGNEEADRKVIGMIFNGVNGGRRFSIYSYGSVTCARMESKSAEVSSSVDWLKA